MSLLISSIIFISLLILIIYLNDSMTESLFMISMIVIVAFLGVIIERVLDGNVDMITMFLCIIEIFLIITFILFKKKYGLLKNRKVDMKKKTKNKNMKK